jgi:hypothetical protein
MAALEISRTSRDDAQAILDALREKGLIPESGEDESENDPLEAERIEIIAFKLDRTWEDGRECGRTMSFLRSVVSQAAV